MEHNEKYEIENIWWLIIILSRKYWDKIKKIKDIEKFYDSKILIDTDDKLLDDITLKGAVMLIACVTKNDDKFYLQLFSEETMSD